MLSRTDINRFGKIMQLILKNHTTHVCKQKCVGFLENYFTCCQPPEWRAFLTDWTNGVYPGGSIK